MNSGICYIAYGEAAQREARLSIESLRRHSRLPVKVYSEWAGGENYDDIQLSRWAKVNMDRWSPFELTCYLDADTRVHGDLSAPFAMLADGWELIITASDHQGDDLLWHVGEADREATLDEVGHVPLQLQAGVFWFRKCARVERLFRAWQEEWSRFEGQDQGALLRALRRAPVRLALLGRCWNGGGLIGHRFGRAKSKKESKSGRVRY